MKRRHHRLVLAAAVVATSLAAAPSQAARIAAFGDTPPVVSKLKVRPASFKALTKGEAVTAKGGALVSFSLTDGVRLTVSYRRATKTGYAAVPGSFIFIGVFGENSIRISGRIAKAALKPGRYRVVLKPAADGAKSAFAPFTIVR